MRFSQAVIFPRMPEPAIIQTSGPGMSEAIHTAERRIVARAAAFDRQITSKLPVGDANSIR